MDAVELRRTHDERTGVADVPAIAEGCVSVSKGGH